MAEPKVPNPKDYPNGNKHNKPHNKNIANNVVAVKDSTLGQKIKNSIISGDISEFRSFVVDDIIWPGLLKAAHGAVDMAFHKDVRSHSTNKRGNTIVHYDRASEGYSSKRFDTSNSRRRDFRDIIFATRGAADDALFEMNDILSEYKTVSIADFYDICELSSISTDNKYGWTDLSDAKVKMVSDGYIIDLPRAVQLERNR